MKQSRVASRSFAVTLIAALGLLLAGSTANAELSDDQRNKLQQAAKHVENAQVNYNLALESAGKGDAQPKGSKARLAAMRLGSAKQYMPPAAELLEALPADDADVQTVQQAYDETQAAITALDNRITGKTAGSEPADAGDPNQGTVKLDYKQEKHLADARYYMNEVSGHAGALTQLVEQIKPVEDQTTINHVVVNQAMNTIAQARQRAGLVQGRLDELPADGVGVPPVTKALADASTQVDSAEEFLAPLHAKLSKIVDPASYPRLEADMQRMSELTRMYYDPNILVNNRPQAAKVVAEAGAARQEVMRIANEYQILVDQKTAEGERIEGIVVHFAEKFGAFATAAQQATESLPGEIQTDMDEAKKYADQAVAEQKPLFFTGGIPQQMGFAQEKLELYEVLAPEQAPAVREQYEALQQEMRDREKSLEALIIQENKLPPDRYTGDDRDALVQMATDTWKQEQPDAEILAAYIPSENWDREERWELHNTTWYKVDRSKLQVQLLVKHDDRLAVNRPINLWIDHVSNDKRTATLFDSIDDELQPQRFILIEKIR